VAAIVLAPSVSRCKNNISEGAETPDFLRLQRLLSAGIRHNLFRMKSSNDRLIRVIAVFKFFKTALLIAIGVGAFRLMHKDIGNVLEHWVEALRLDPGRHFLDVALAKASDLRPEQIRKLGLGSFLYAGLFLTEGTGLWLRKRWAEWLTTIITSSLVPVEIYEIHRHPGWVKVGVLAVNVAVVVYLIWHMRSRRP
jgi:uncharacterized membrane protein (DUF2068 family)